MNLKSLTGKPYNSKPIRTLLQLILFLIIVCIHFNAVAQTSPRLYICMNDLTPGSELYMRRGYADKPVLVSQRFIDPQNTMTLDTIQLKIGLERLFPNRDASGIGVLDWEGKAFRVLRAGKADKDFGFVLEQYILAIKMAKSLRPNVRWGFYELPIITPLGRKGSQDISSLLKECDLFFPSFYQFYPSSIGKNNIAAVRDDLNYIISLGIKYEKPVFAFVWHRWTVKEISEKELQLISLEQFKKHIQLLSTFRLKGKGLDGIVWWGAEKYFYETNALSKDEFGRYKNFGEYHTKLINRYFKGIRRYFK